MKKMFLTSSWKFVTEYLQKYLEKPIGEYKFAYITTAKKWTDDQSYVQDRKKAFEKQNIDYQEIDIEEYEALELKELLQSKDIIYIEWWNTFYLMNAINIKWFQKTLNDLVEQWKIYVWSSAWAYICCPNIEMATWKTNKVRNKYWLKDLSWLGFIDFLIFVHYKPEYDTVLKNKIRKNKYKVKILKDGQALMIKWDDIQFIGEWTEINLWV